MTDDQVIDDLKQFITSTVHGEVSVIDSKLSEVRVVVKVLKTDVRIIKIKVNQLSYKVDNIPLSLAETIDTFNDDVGKRISNH